VLLGLVLEAATGQSYSDLVAELLTGPLGLDHTTIALTGDANPAIVDCYAADGVTNLTGSMDPSMGWAAGAGVSTPADLARWAVALYGGEVLSEDALRRMTTPVTLTDGTPVEHGIGAFVETDGVDSLYDHTGGFEGYQTYMYYWEADDVAVVVLANQLEVDLRDLAAYGWSVPLDFEHP
jgi:D-alanyl-D-alanine carboxypeptidase